MSEDIEKQKKDLMNSYLTSVNQLLTKANDMCKSSRVVIDMRLEKSVASAMKTETLTEVRQATDKYLEAKESLRHLELLVKRAKDERDALENTRMQLDGQLETIIDKYGKCIHTLYINT